MLTSSLASHRDISAYHELFNPVENPDWSRARLSTREYLERWRAALPRVQAAGFALHRWHAEQDDSLLEAVAELQPRVVLLHRLGLLDQLCSHLLAQETQRWWQGASKNLPPSTTRLWIDPEQAVADFEQYVAETAGNRRFWVEHRFPVLELTYEALVERWDRAIEAVQDFLHVPRRTLRPATRKQETRPKRQIIENYEDLVAAWKGTEWERVLDQ